MAHADQVGTRLLAETLAKRAVIGGGDLRLAAARGFIAGLIESTDDIGALTQRWARDGVQQDGQRTRLLVRKVDSHRVKITTELHRDQEAGELVGGEPDADPNRPPNDTGEAWGYPPAGLTITCGARTATTPCPVAPATTTSTVSSATTASRGTAVATPSSATTPHTTWSASPARRSRCR